MEKGIKTGDAKITNNVDNAEDYDTVKELSIKEKYKGFKNKKNLKIKIK